MSPCSSVGTGDSGAGVEVGVPGVRCSGPLYRAFHARGDGGKTIVGELSTCVSYFSEGERGSWRKTTWRGSGGRMLRREL